MDGGTHARWETFTAMFKVFEVEDEVAEREVFAVVF